MNLVITDMKELIEAGTDLIYEQTLFLGQEPTSPSNLVTLYDTPGGGSWLAYNRELDRYDYSAFQVRVRHVSYEDAMQQAYDIVGILHGIGNTIIGGTLYTLVEALDNPFLLDYDDNNRALIITNYAVQRTPQPVT